MKKENVTLDPRLGTCDPRHETFDPRQTFKETHGNALMYSNDT